MKYEPIILEYRGRYEAPTKSGLHEDFEDLYYSMLEESVKWRKDFVERKALGLKPIPPYP
ncbi:MAG: hypothetical protein ABSA11_09500 [Candidatus Bathyarchaeia archaeon]|jgi:hypothetical protein